MEGKRTTDVWISGVKYFLVSLDTTDGVACLKRRNGGACIVRTHICVIVATYSEQRFTHASLADCASGVFGFARNLRSFNF